jgi:hypothetical protein
LGMANRTTFGLCLQKAKVGAFPWRVLSDILQHWTSYTG